MPQSQSWTDMHAHKFASPERYRHAVAELRKPMLIPIGRERELQFAGATLIDGMATALEYAITAMQRGGRMDRDSCRTIDILTDLRRIMSGEERAK